MTTFSSSSLCAADRYCRTASVRQAETWRLRGTQPCSCCATAFADVSQEGGHGCGDESRGEVGIDRGWGSKEAAGRHRVQRGRRPGAIEALPISGSTVLKTAPAGIRPARAAEELNIKFSWGEEVMAHSCKRQNSRRAAIQHL